MSLTFDNVGEAAALEFGQWPQDRQIGNHPSVSDTLPQLLSVLREKNVTASFFVEAWNVSVYPDALLAIAQGGHEIGCHGFRHETWHALPDGRQSELLAKATDAYRTLGVTAKGFRPPGGVLTTHSAEVLRSLGYCYASPLEPVACVRDGLAILPVDGSATDLAYYEPAFAKYRRPVEGPQSTGPEGLVQGFELALDDAIANGAYLSATFHVTTPVDEDRLEALRSVIDRFAFDDRVWFAPCHAVADWLLRECTGERV